MRQHGAGAEMCKAHRIWGINWRKLLNQDVFSILAVVLVGLLFFRRALFPLGAFVSGDIGGSDFSDFFLPVKAFLARSLNSKQIPLWTDKVGFGFPFLAEGQIQAFFPTSILFLFLPTTLAYNLCLFLAVLGIGISTYLFLRRGLGLHALPALFGAVAFAFGAPVTMRWKHLPILSVLALFPLEMLAVKELFRGCRFSFHEVGPHKAKMASREPFSSAGLFFIISLAVLIGFQFLAGHPQMTIYCLVVFGFYFLFNLVGAVFLGSRLKDEKEPFITNREICLSLKLLAVFGLAVLLGLALGAVQLFPSLELKRYSLRASGLSYKETQIYPFFLKHLVTLLVPFSFGDPSKWAPYLEFDPHLLVWEICAYSGLFTAIFGLLEVFRMNNAGSVNTGSAFAGQESANSGGFSSWCGVSSRGISPSAFFAFLVGFSALQARFNFLYFLPTLSSFRVSARFVIFISFGLAVLAALFLEGIVFNQILPRWEELGKPPLLQRLSSLWAGRLAGILLFALVAVLVADLYLNLGDYNQTVASSNWWATPRSVDFLKRKLGDFRVLPLLEGYLASSIYSEQRGWRKDPEAFLDCQELVPANRNLVWNIPSASVYAPVGISRVSNLLGFIYGGFQMAPEAGKLNPAPGMGRLLSLGAVRYILSPLEVVGDGFETVFSSDLAHCGGIRGCGIWISEVKEALPRVRFVPRAKFVSSEKDALECVLQGLADPAETVILEGEDKTDRTDKTDKTSGTGGANIIVNEDQKIVIRVSAPQDGYLVLSDTYYPGWKAYIATAENADENAKRGSFLWFLRTSQRSLRLQEILRANYNFRAVPVPKGEHIVTFVYEPESFRQGLAISIVSLGLLASLFVYWRLRRSNK